MYCQHCGQPINDNQAVCLQCGAKVGQGGTFCANCGQPIYAGAQVCTSCGVAIKKGLGGQDKMTMILLCFFLGGFGIHNFMMGETKKGVVKIVASACCGLGGILALIDLIKIACDKYDVDPDKLF